jgi:hypothetical protein
MSLRKKLLIIVLMIAQTAAFGNMAYTVHKQSTALTQLEMRHTALVKELTHVLQFALNKIARLEHITGKEGI